MSAYHKKTFIFTIGEGKAGPVYAHDNQGRTTSLKKG